MYHTITLNVIRQALAYANLPSPVKITQIESGKVLDGQIYTHFRACFSLVAACESIHALDSLTRRVGIGWIEWFNSAFSYDVLAYDVHANFEDDLLYIEFRTEFDPTVRDV